MYAPDEAAAILVDQAGVVFASTGMLRDLPANPVGRHWRDVLGSAGDVAELPTPLPALPWNFEFLARDGAAISVSSVPAQPPQTGHLLMARRNPSVDEDDLRHERMTALGWISAGVAHEMNNVLTIICGWLQLWLKEEGEGERRKTLQIVSDSADRLGQLTHDLLNFARAPLNNTSAFNVNNALEDLLALVEYQLQRGGVLLERAFSEAPVSVQGNRTEIGLVCLNLIINAMHAMPKGGRLTLRTAVDAEGPLIEITDTGSGMSEEVRRNLFRPFYTTRADDGGSGIGLKVCGEIMARHRGRISVRSAEGAGATFTLRFPSVSENREKATHVVSA